MRFRNVSCFVSGGSAQRDGSLVDDELCGDVEPSVNGETHIVLKEACIVPCPGRALTATVSNTRTKSITSRGQCFKNSNICKCTFLASQ